MKKNKYIIISAVAIILFLVAVVIGLFVTGKDNTAVVDEKLLPYYLHPGYEIISVGIYDGEFVEDGSDAQVSDVCMITVRNNTSENISLLEIQAVDTDGEVYEFTVTTLLSNSQITVLEKNAKKIKNTTEFTEFTVLRDVEFSEPLSVHSDKFEITAMDTVFNIRNISSQSFDNPVYIYYKTKSDNGYFGGITYRARVDAIKSGEFRQISASHFDIESSEVIFVSFTS